jgi:hypothetical protein
LGSLALFEMRCAGPRPCQIVGQVKSSHSIATTAALQANQANPTKSYAGLLAPGRLVSLGQQVLLTYTVRVMAERLSFASGVIGVLRR